MTQKFLHLHILLHLHFLFLCTASFGFISCNSPTNPPEKFSVELTAIDASCIEVWLEVKAEAIPLPQTFKLYENNTEKGEVVIDNSDTVLVIENLLPNRNYKYKLENEKGASSETEITTMDTTSHNFTWQTFEFGEHSSSSLYDVAIIDENNIWAVGEIYMLDSLGNTDPKAYNAVHWDGSEWELKRIPIYLGSGSFYPVIKSIFAFGADDVWFEAGIHWDGISFRKISFNISWSGNINKLWGSASSDLYAVGNNGNIAHWDGVSWKKIESGTDVDLKDIYGTPDGKNVWISGYEDFKPTVLLKISNSIVETIFNSRDYLFVFNPDHISGEITSVWTNSNNFVYVTTPYSLYRKSIYIDPSIEEALRFGNPLSWLGRRSRGTDINNIFIAGNRSNVHHYNGVNFKTYQELANNGVTYYSLAVRGNLSVLCGQKFENGINDKSIITINK